jgi:uncharacterized membrane protein|tara:strand:- start:9 stop:374 length:366 start_codon:yes stop_codon:yes gene_type:complete
MLSPSTKHFFPNTISGFFTPAHPVNSINEAVIIANIFIWLFICVYYNTFFTFVNQINIPNKGGYFMDPIKWVKDRTDERTSWDGAVLILCGVIVLIAGPFAKLAAWGAIGYGAWTLWKKEK